MERNCLVLRINLSYNTTCLLEKEFILNSTLIPGTLIPGLMKDESGGKIMTEFVALRPKLYSYKVLDGSEDKKCKGIKKCFVKKTLTFEDYKTCLFSDSTEYRSELMFRSAKHEVHTIEVNKAALN